MLDALHVHITSGLASASVGGTVTCVRGGLSYTLSTEREDYDSQQSRGGEINSVGAACGRGGEGENELVWNLNPQYHSPPP